MRRHSAAIDTDSIHTIDRMGMYSIQHQRIARHSESEPRHRIEHEHDWKLMGEFKGRRAAIYQCADKTCEQTRTVWRTEADS